MKVRDKLFQVLPLFFFYFLSKSLAPYNIPRETLLSLYNFFTRKSYETWKLFFSCVLNGTTVTAPSSRLVQFGKRQISLQKNVLRSKNIFGCDRVESSATHLAFFFINPSKKLLPESYCKTKILRTSCHLNPMAICLQINTSGNVSSWDQ